MAEPLKSKRSGPLPMQRAIRAARINRRFDQVQEQMCRALEALKPLPNVEPVLSADAATPSSPGKDWYRAALEPFVRHVAPAVSAGAAGSDRSATASGRGIPR